MGLGLAAATAAHARSWPGTHFDLGQETLAKFGFLKHFSKLMSAIINWAVPLSAVTDAACFFSPLPSPLCCGLCVPGCPRWRPVRLPLGPRAVCAFHVAFDACALLLEAGALDTLYRNETICNLVLVGEAQAGLAGGLFIFQFI